MGRGTEHGRQRGRGHCLLRQPAAPPADIQALLPRFTGNIQQTPPQFSAIKVNGERAYALARAGEEVELVARPVTVYGLRLLGVTPDSAELEMECGKGTYVRSIARDMGQILGCFGYISALRRTVGNFSENNAIPLDEFEKMVQISGADRFLLPVETVLDDIPALAMTDTEVSRIRQGQTLKFISRQDFDRLSVAGMDGMTGLLLAIADNKPLALLEKDGVEPSPGALVQPLTLEEEYPDVDCSQERKICRYQKVRAERKRYRLAGSPDRPSHEAHHRTDRAHESSQERHDQRRGLLIMVSNRRRLLNYVKKVSSKRYEVLIDSLGLRR